MVRWVLMLVVLLASPELMGWRQAQVQAQEADQAAATAADLEFFEKSVRPVLIDRCISCHGPEKAKNDLRLDGRAAMLEGGVMGPALVPGKPEESLLVEAVTFEGTLKMPPKGKLSDAEIQALTEWVQRGAPWPGEPSQAAATSSPKTPNIGPEEWQKRAGHWAFQPLKPAPTPTVQNSDWCAGPIDAWILAKLEENRLTPAPRVEKRTLIRRLSFDLLGLPPTPAEVQAFLADTRPDAYERLVDRLLASPRFGERWGRHWLDLVRYGDTLGHEFDFEIPNAYRYRDYVIDALNADLPYDQFVREQLAGDLLKNPRIEPITGRNLSILGTGFALLGEGPHSPVDAREEQIRRVDNQIDVLGKTFLGLTLACARCHDHKFDPLSQRDYYAMAGFFQSSRYQQVPLEDDQSRAALAELKERLKELRAEPELAPLALVPEAAAAASPEPSPGTSVFASFQQNDFGAWKVAGPAFGTGPSQAGDLRLVKIDNLPAVQPVPPGVAHSGLTADRLRGALRSPTFTITSRYVQYLAWGQGGRINLVVDGFEKIRDPIYGPLTFGVNAPDAPRWFVQDAGMWLGHKAYIEISDGATTDFNSSSGQIHGGDGFIAVAEIRFSDKPDTPAAPAAAPARPISNPTLGSRADAVLAQAAALPDVAMALTLADGSGDDEHVLVRGNPKNLGVLAPRRFLEVIAGPEPTTDASGSGRLDLAERMLDPTDPLPARVMVNRLWQHHFGRGLVPTPDDFGHMGQAPSHPELLDLLADELIRSGWSLKHLHRLMVLSQTYQMNSVPDAQGNANDPDNRWLHRARLKRLEAEALRDNLLALSGQLVQTMHGPGVMPHLTPSMDGRGRPGSSGPLDGAGRRSVYLGIRRNFLQPFLLAFDFPAPAGPMGRRNISNVPAQALTLLNDPLVLEQARIWAERTLAEPAANQDERLTRMFETAFARPPTAEERATAHHLLGDSADPAAWADLAHILINVKEFSFIP